MREHHIKSDNVASGNFVTAKPMGVREGVDLLHTGEVRKIDAEAIRRRLAQNEIVVLSPLGYSPTGEVFNLTLEDVATSAAIALDAEKLIFLMDTAGVYDNKDVLIRQMTAAEGKAILAAKHKLPEDAGLYLPCAVRACCSGVNRAHLISRHVDGALLLSRSTSRQSDGWLASRSLTTCRPGRSQTASLTATSWASVSASSPWVWPNARL